MNLTILPLSLSVGLGFLLLVPLISIMKPQTATPPDVAAHRSNNADGASLTPPIPHRLFPADERTPCEVAGNCVSIYDDILGFSMPEKGSASTSQKLAGQPFRCQTRIKNNGGNSVVCRLNTNAASEAEHEASLAAVLGAMRDRHGAERSLNRRRETAGHIKEVWDWGSRRRGDHRRTLRVTARWRYNPTGRGVPNVIKLAWQEASW